MSKRKLSREDATVGRPAKEARVDDMEFVAATPVSLSDDDVSVDPPSGFVPPAEMEDIDPYEIYLQRKCDADEDYRSQSDDDAVPDAAPARADTDIGPGIDAVVAPPGNKNPTFRGMNLAFCVPHSGDLTTEECGLRFIKYFGLKIDRIAVLQHSGDDSDHIHLHGIVCFKKQPKVTFRTLNSVIGVVRDNNKDNNDYGSVRDMKAYLVYMQHERAKVELCAPYCKIVMAAGDPPTLMNFDIRLFADTFSQKAKRVDLMFDHIKENGYNWKALIDKFGANMVETAKKKLKSYAGGLDEQPTHPWVPFPTDINPLCEAQSLLYAHTNDICAQLLAGKQPALKDNVIVLEGETSVHKSGFYKHLKKSFCVCNIVMDPKYPFPRESDCTYDFVIMDSFDGQTSMPADFVERFIDGDKDVFHGYKGGYMSFKKRPIFIINTNTPFKQWYPNLSHSKQKALAERLCWFYIHSPLTNFPDPDDDGTLMTMAVGKKYMRPVV